MKQLLTKNNIENIMAMINSSLPKRMRPQWREIYTKGNEFYIQMGYKLPEEEYRSHENEFKKHKRKEWQVYGKKEKGILTLTEYWLEDKYTFYGFNAPDRWYEEFRQSMYPLTNWGTKDQYQLHETILNYLKNIKTETIVSKKMGKKILEKIKYFYFWKTGYSPETIDRFFEKIETVVAVPTMGKCYDTVAGMKFDFANDYRTLQVCFYN